MFFRILKKDLQRKRAMNLILLLFIIMSAMFLASSVSNLVTVFGAVDHFFELANVPDYLAISLAEGEDDPIEEFLEENEWVTEYQVLDTINLPSEQIEIESRAAQADKANYEKLSILSICPIPDNFLKVFDGKEQPLALKNGEIALARPEAEKNQLVVGDVLKIRVGDVTQEFTVKEIVKDAAFGTTMMGFKRFFVTEHDYLEFAEQEGIAETRLYCVNYGNADAFQNSFRKMQFTTLTTVDRETMKMSYVMDMLMTVILIVVSVCLIFVAFLVLRFMIVFTLQEDYREIGVMKALGIPDGGIKGVYLVKYLALSVMGALIGFALSFPFGNLLLSQTIANIMVEESKSNILIHIACAAAVVLVVSAFCYGSTNRLKKISVMEAIRNGSDGERYHAKSRISLHGRNGMKPYFYLACNDIIGNVRRFLMLLVIFFIGTQMILLPLSAVNTLKSDELVRSFSLVQSDVYLTDQNEEKYVVEGETALREDLEEIKEELKGRGYTALAWAEVGYTTPVYANDPDELYNYFTLCRIGDEPKEGYQLLEGSEPKLSDEVMITEKTAEEMGVTIGDSIYYKLPEGDAAFVITGIYQSMINMGNGMRVSSEADLGESTMAGVFSEQIEIEGLEEEEACELLKEIYPKNKIRGARGFMKDMLGSIIEQLDAVEFFIVVLVLLINSLITALMMKTFIAKERGEIAMLKSIGFADRTIRSWQTARIVLILAAAIVIGTAASRLLIPLVIVPIFAMMGATQMEVITEPLQAYIICPVLLLLVTGMVAYLGAREVRRIDCKEINNME